MIDEFDFLKSLIGEKNNLRVFTDFKEHYVFFVENNYYTCNVVDKLSVRETLKNINKKVNLIVQ